MKTRREFLKTVAAGSAAALATVATQSTAATVVKSVVDKTKSRGAAPPAHAAHSERMDPAEIAKQKKYTADALKVIRDYVLPAGSPMAFSFKPLKAARGHRPR